MSPAAMSCGFGFPGGSEGDGSGSGIISDASFGGDDGTNSGGESRRRFVLCSFDGMGLLCFLLGSLPFRIACRADRVLVCRCSLHMCRGCALDHTGGGEDGMLDAKA
ncbi:hypothetical protein SETIT_5G311300v2 [Setaria italica]|uniref:Uncharacterized protein n=1 Tax=Setaria italica TaxID=4555 RepID=A0A368RB11_SETIT|nr:hypothetical protein SETIT_5G311300v2 [Setaria italica]